jgi:hypothetical protein
LTVLNIGCHTIVLFLFHPFADLRPQPKLLILTSQDATPAAVVGASIKQLERLVYIYRSSFESAEYCILWHSAMLDVVKYVLRAYNGNEAYFYFLLCMRGYERLARCIPIARGIMQSIFAITQRYGTMLPQDAEALFEEIRNENAKTMEFLSMYPIDMALASTDVEAATVESLLKGFYEFVLKERVGGNMQPEDTLLEGWKGETELLATSLADNARD